MIVYLKLTTAGIDTGPFNLYTDLDGFTTPFEINVAKSVLVAGYYFTTVPDYTQTVRIQSVGDCINYTDIELDYPECFMYGTASALTSSNVLVWDESVINSIRSFIEIQNASTVFNQNITTKFTLTAISTVSNAYVYIPITGGDLYNVSDNASHNSLISQSSMPLYSMDFVDATSGDSATFKVEVTAIDIDTAPSPYFITFTQP